MKAFIHEKGFKGEQDRKKCSRDYRQLCKYFHVKPLSDLALTTLSTLKFYQMCEDIFNRQSHKAQRAFCEKMYGLYNVKYRRKPLAFKWFYLDLLRLSPMRGAHRLALALSSPIRYVKVLRRIEKERLEKEVQAKLELVK
jgi:hypothetical protein